MRGRRPGSGRLGRVLLLAALGGALGGALGIAAGTAGVAAAATGPGQPTHAYPPLGLVESSGMAASVLHAGVVWVVSRGGTEPPHCSVSTARAGRPATQHVHQPNLIGRALPRSSEKLRRWREPPRRS